MQIQKYFCPLLICLFLSAGLNIPQAFGSTLTIREIERLRVVKRMLSDVDTKSVEQTMRELDKTRHPQTRLEMMEAIASTYTDLIRDYHLGGLKKKQWIYSMVCLNMAYLQFGGQKGKSGSTTELNRLIRQELLKYLPADIQSHPGFIYSLE